MDTMAKGDATPTKRAEHPQVTLQAQSIKKRDAFWLQAAQAIHWHEAPKQAFGASSRRGPYSYGAMGGQYAYESPPGANGYETTPSTWFPNASTNTCYNCLDRHVYPPADASSSPLTAPLPEQDAQAANKIAFHHVSPLPFQQQQYRSFTYAEALEQVQTLAGVLTHIGVRKGDVVTIYMPMIPETAFAMLACARIGAIHSVVFGGFAAKELAKRVQDAQSTLVIAASCGLEPKGPVEYRPLVEQAIGHSTHKPSSGVLFLRRQTIKGHAPPQPTGQLAGVREYDWEEECAAVRSGKDGRERHSSCVPVGSEEPLYTLYTSGTTGTPKGVVRLSGGHLVQLRYSIEQTFGMRSSDTMLCASDLGWVVGHSYILYAPLLLGASTVIFEGKPVTPDAGILWRTIAKLGVTHLFTAPTALRAVRGLDPDAKLMRGSDSDLRTLRTLFLAGERSEPQIVEAYSKLLQELGAPGAGATMVNDNYWSTESGSPITALMLNGKWPALPCRPGSAGLPQPGMDVRVVDDLGREVKRGEMGNLVLAKPLPPSALGGLWNNSEGFYSSYWKRFDGRGDWFDTGDAARIDEDGYVTILARADDIIQVAGHRLGTGLIEQVVTAHPDVVECCVVGAPDRVKGQVPFALVVARPSSSSSAADILKNINDHVRKEVGAIAQLKGLVSTAKLPKTRSGKTLRKTIRAIVERAAADAQQQQLQPTASGPAPIKESELPVPPTIEDRDCLLDNIAKIQAYFAADAQGQQTKAKL